MTTIQKVFLILLMCLAFCLTASAQALNVHARPLSLDEKKQLHEKTKVAQEARKAACAADRVPEDVCNRSPLFVPFKGVMWKVSIHKLDKTAVDAMAAAKAKGVK